MRRETDPSNNPTQLRNRPSLTSPRAPDIPLSLLLLAIAIVVAIVVATTIVIVIECQCVSR
jgi:hypothetical protein